jgi:hypothetical protein
MSREKNNLAFKGVPLTLKLRRADEVRLQKAGRYGVRNAIASVARFALEPARDQARILSPQGVGRSFETFRQGLRGIGDTYVVRNKKKKIRSYRAGVRKKGAYRMRGRVDGIGDVTLLLSIKPKSDYYNFVANFWEHGWTARGVSVPGNQFMTRAVQYTTPKIARGYSLAMAKAIEISPRRLRASDLRTLGRG